MTQVCYKQFFINQMIFCKNCQDNSQASHEKQKTQNWHNFKLLAYALLAALSAFGESSNAPTGSLNQAPDGSINTP